MTGLVYDRRGDRVHLNLGGTAVFRRARARGPIRIRTESRDVISTGYIGEAVMDARVRPTVVIDASGGVLYDPFFQFTQFAVADPASVAVGPDLIVVVPEGEYAVLSRQNRMLIGSFGATSEFTRRSSVRGSVSWRSTHFPELPEGDLQDWSALGTLTHRFARSWSLRFDGGRETVEYRLKLQAPIVQNSAGVSIDYGSESPLSRRIAFSGSVRTSAVAQGPDTNHRLEGGAQVSRGFGRTWSASFAYDRRTEYVAGVVGPLSSDSFAVSVNGLIAARAEWASRISASRGEAGFDVRQPFAAYAATSRLTVGLTRMLGAYGQYSYARYEVPSGLTVFEDGSRFSRHRISAGLSFWLPLLTETRVPLDPR